MWSGPTALKPKGAPWKRIKQFVRNSNNGAKTDGTSSELEHSKTASGATERNTRDLVWIDRELLRNFGHDIESGCFYTCNGACEMNVGAISTASQNPKIVMLALTRRETLRPAQEQSSKTSGKSRERLTDAHGSATPVPATGPSPPAPPRGLPVFLGREVGKPTQTVDRELVV